MSAGASHRRTIIGAATVAALVLAWELIAALGLIDTTFSGRPTGILAGGYHLFATQPMGRELWVTLTELVLGFTAAAAVGVPLGLILGLYPRLRAFVDPVLMALYSSPRAALIPILIIWFGLGLTTKVSVAFLGAVFPAILNGIAGIQAVDSSWVRAASAFGATRRDLIWRVYLPGALPYLAAGLRLGLGRAVTGVIIAELYINTEGLGRQLMRAQVGLNANNLMFLVLLISGFAVVAINLLRWLEERLGKWRQELN